MSAGLLSKAELLVAVGQNQRWLKRHGGRFSWEPTSEAHGNGKPVWKCRLDSLPAEAQRRWAERHALTLVQAPAAAPEAGGAPALPAAMPGAQLALALTAPDPLMLELGAENQALAARRYQIIEPLVERQRHSLAWQQCGNQRLRLIAWLAAQHQVGARSIYRWELAYRKGGMRGLVNRDRSDRGQGRSINDAALQYLVSAALPREADHRQNGRGEMSVAEIFRAYQEERVWRMEHGPRGAPLSAAGRAEYAHYLDPATGRLQAAAQLPSVSYETLRSWHARIPEILKVWARQGRKTYEMTQELVIWRDLAAMDPLDYVVMDHRLLDRFCMVREDSAGWRLIRPWVTAAIDMATRRWLAWVIVEQPSSDSIAAVLRRALLDHGIPQHVYWDNGKDFRCHYLEGADALRERRAPAIAELPAAMRGVIGRLGIRVTHALPENPRAKTIEANFLRTSLYDKTCPEWCGHKPQARPERFERLLHQHEQWLAGKRAEPAFPTIEQIADDYDDLLRALNDRPLRGPGMEKIDRRGRAWMSPNERWAQGMQGMRDAGQTPALPAAEEIAFAFLRRRALTVQHGEVQATFGGRLYHYRLRDNKLGLLMLNGRQVELAYDPLDLGTVAIVHEEKLVGLADSVELRGMGEEGFQQDLRDRAAARKRIKEFIETLHRAVPVQNPAARAMRRAARGGRRAPAGDPAPAPERAPMALIEAAVAAAPQRPADQGDDEFRFFTSRR